MSEPLRLEFNEWARAGKGASMERGHRPVGEQAIERMQIPTEATVLDVGCGSGWAARLMAQRARDGRVVGIDVSDEMVRLAREESVNHPNVEFQVASAEQLPFDDAEFTHAFSMESLYYYADIERALGRDPESVEARRTICGGRGSLRGEHTFSSVDRNAQGAGAVVERR